MEKEKKSEIILELAWLLQQKPLQINEIVKIFGIARATAHNYMNTIKRVYNIERQELKYLITDKIPKKQKENE